MSITDELREYASNNNIMHYHHEYIAIADRIDAEHESACAEAYTKGCEDGMGMANAKDARAEYLRGKNDGYDEGWDAGFASADDWRGQHEDVMAEHGWVRLPKDADGKHIHAGDVLDGYGKTIEVVELRIGRSGWVIISRDGNGYADTFAFAHHHAPAVEDVLRELLDEAEHFHSLEEEKEAIAEYAAKLRLAEGVTA